MVECTSRQAKRIWNDSYTESFYFCFTIQSIIRYHPQSQHMFFQHLWERNGNLLCPSRKIRWTFVPLPQPNGRSSGGHPRWMARTMSPCFDLTFFPKMFRCFALKGVDLSWYNWIVIDISIYIYIMSCIDIYLVQRWVAPLPCGGELLGLCFAEAFFAIKY